MVVSLLKSTAPDLVKAMRHRWFWGALICIGYLISLYAVLLGLGHGYAFIGIPLALAPAFCTQFNLRDRLQATAIAGLFVYFVFLTILVRNSYFPSTAIMIIELFFILLITIPAFLIRAPLYALMGIGQFDWILLLSGVAFLGLFAWGVWQLPRMHERPRSMMLMVVMVSIFITFNECINLGLGIKTLSEIGDLDPSVRNYYRVAVNNVG